MLLPLPTFSNTLTIQGTLRDLLTSRINQIPINLHRNSMLTLEYRMSRRPHQKTIYNIRPNQHQPPLLKRAHKHRRQVLNLHANYLRRKGQVSKTSQVQKQAPSRSRRRHRRRPSRDRTRSRVTRSPLNPIVTRSPVPANVSPINAPAPTRIAQPASHYIAKSQTPQIHPLKQENQIIRHTWPIPAHQSQFLPTTPSEQKPS